MQSHKARSVQKYPFRKRGYNSFLTCDSKEALDGSSPLFTE